MTRKSMPCALELAALEMMTNTPPGRVPVPFSPSPEMAAQLERYRAPQLEKLRAALCGSEQILVFDY